MLYAGILPGDPHTFFASHPLLPSGNQVSTPIRSYHGLRTHQKKTYCWESQSPQPADLGRSANGGGLESAAAGLISTQWGVACAAGLPVVLLEVQTVQPPFFPPLILPSSFPLLFHSIDTWIVDGLKAEHRRRKAETSGVAGSHSCARPDPRRLVWVHLWLVSCSTWGCGAMGWGSICIPYLLSFPPPVNTLSLLSWPYPFRSADKS